MEKLSEKGNMTKQGDFKRGQKQGKKEPFTNEEIIELKEILVKTEQPRDLSLLCVGLDSHLRSSDLRALKWRDVLNEQEGLKRKFHVVQRKTGAIIQVELTPETIQILTWWYNESKKKEYTYIFNSRKKLDFPISYPHHTCLVKKWAKLLGLNPDVYSTHSIRRSVPSLFYNQKKDAEACRIVLGHNSISSTSHYLGINELKALENIYEIKLGYCIL